MLLSMQTVAQIILVRRDGAIILQHRDDKPGITNPGALSAFGGNVEPGETPLQAAYRELQEETNLVVQLSELEFFGVYAKTRAKHGEDREVHYFITRNVDDTGFKVYEGQGFYVIHNLAELRAANTSPLVREVLEDYYAEL